MFNLGTQVTPQKVNHIPYIPHLKENNVRTGYFEYEEFTSLRDTLPKHLKQLITMAYFTDMRKGEMLSLEWSQVDLMESKITLEAGTTKNDEVRVIYMDGELYEAIAFQKGIRDDSFPECPYVFLDDKGDPLGSFRKTWKSACKKAGLDGKLFYDFRRTAIRNKVFYD